MEKITVISRSDIITSASGREYFTLSDETERKLICFNPKLREFLPIGNEAEIEVEAGKQESDTPRLTNVYKDGQPIIKPETKAPGRAYGKSKEELLQIRQLAEIQNRSIQAQVAFKGALEIFMGGIVEPPVEKGATIKAVRDLATEFYHIIQSLTQITTAEVIHREIKTAQKEAINETQKNKPATVATPQVRQPPREETGVDDTGGGEVPVTNAQELMKWAIGHGKEYGPGWVRQIAGLGTALITDEKAVEAYKNLKALMAWD